MVRELSTEQETRTRAYLDDGEHAPSTLDQSNPPACHSTTTSTSRKGPGHEPVCSSDGLQLPGVGLPVENRVEVVSQLLQLIHHLLCSQPGNGTDVTCGPLSPTDLSCNPR